MTRRHALRVLGTGSLVGALGSLAGARAQSAPPPNILFIMSDDHAAHAIGCYGSRVNQTPNIDRIAAEGMRLDDCFCTNSLCAPSRAAILTGKYSHRNGVKDNNTAFDGRQQTLPKLLQRAGYQTALIGKWHLQSEPTGFDYWSILPGQGAYVDPVFLHKGGRGKLTGYVTDLITDQTLSWLRSGRDRERPFFLMCHHKAPHRNWVPDSKHADLYRDTTIPEPSTLRDDYATRSAAAREQAMTVLHNLTPSDLKGATPPPGLSEDELRSWKYQVYMKDYLRCIAAVDDNVGRLLDYLDRSGLAETTLVVYTSDQGFFLGDHGWFDKRFMYEESLRMPFVIRHPALVRAGSVSRDLMINIDFAPTFLDVAGVAAPRDMQGRSFREILGGHTPGDWRESVYYHYYEYPAEHSVKRHYGVRTRRYKLIRFYYDIDAWELYDLERDPRELRNVYDDPAYAGVREDLRRELERLRRHYGDNTAPPVGWPV
jgi:arylsulfatase A-like enzyme